MSSLLVSNAHMATARPPPPQRRSLTGAVAAPTCMPAAATCGRRRSQPDTRCAASRLDRSSSGGTQLRAVALAEPELAAVCAEEHWGAVSADSSSWPTFPSSFEWGEVLGEGSFGRVRVATDTLTGEQYAVKIVSKRLQGRDRTAAIEDEVRRAGRCRGRRWRWRCVCRWWWRCPAGPAPAARARWAAAGLAGAAAEAAC
jgi:hypothetical protein